MLFGKARKEAKVAAKAEVLIAKKEAEDAGKAIMETLNIEKAGKLDFLYYKEFASQLLDDEEVEEHSQGLYEGAPCHAFFTSKRAMVMFRDKTGWIRTLTMPYARITSISSNQQTLTITIGDISDANLTYFVRAREIAKYLNNKIML